MASALISEGAPLAGYQLAEDGRWHRGEDGLRRWLRDGQPRDPARALRGACVRQRHFPGAQALWAAQNLSLGSPLSGRIGFAARKRLLTSAGKKLCAAVPVTSPLTFSLIPPRPHAPLRRRWPARLSAATRPRSPRGPRRRRRRAGVSFALNNLPRPMPHHLNGRAPRLSSPPQEPVFYSSDLEGVKGKYDVVTCLDVMIHYPQDKADAMVQHLASLAEKRLIVSFAPYTFSLALLKRIGARVRRAPYLSRAGVAKPSSRAVRYLFENSPSGGSARLCWGNRPLRTPLSSLPHNQPLRRALPGLRQGDPRLPPQGGGRRGCARQGACGIKRCRFPLLDSLVLSDEDREAVLSTQSERDTDGETLARALILRAGWVEGEAPRDDLDELLLLQAP